MKLKEAQILGILTVIAVGIILLCLWGGRDKPAEPQARSTDPAQYDFMRPDARDAGAPASPTNMNELMRALQEQGASAGTAPTGVSGIVVVGGSAPPPAAPVPPTAPARPAAGAPGFVTPAVSAPPAAPRPVEAAPPVVHTVQKGDTLFAISHEHYKSTSHWKLILDANSSVIKSPGDLRPGMKLTIPPLPSAGGAAAAPATTGGATVVAAAGGAPSDKKVYEVQKGDSLYTIAAKHYGNANRWKDIWEVNKDQLPKPESLKIGMRLTLP
jgi:nucleoid-associated protein YgaU